MQVHCIYEPSEFEDFDGHHVVATLYGSEIAFVAGALLLRHTDKVIGPFERFAAGLVDLRDPWPAVHSVRTMIARCMCTIVRVTETTEHHDGSD